MNAQAKTAKNPQLPKIIKPEDATVFSVKKKIGKPFTVKVPNDMIKELKNEYMSSVITIEGGARDKITKYLLKKYGGSMGKNKYVYKVLEKIEKHAMDLAEKEKNKIPDMDRVAVVVISTPGVGNEVLLVDIPWEESKKIKNKLKKNPEKAREDLKYLLVYLGYPVNDVILDNALADIKDGGEAPVIDPEGNKQAMTTHNAEQLAMADSRKIIDFVQNVLKEAKKKDSYVKKAEYYLEKANKAYAGGSYTYAKILAAKAMQSVKISKVEKSE